MELGDRWIGLRTWRPLVMGRRGVVAANHPLAAEAGVAILRRGGNAADAYLAAASTLAVVEPHMSGLGGEGFALIYDAGSGDATVVNATGRAPLAATPERFRDGIPTHGPRPTITPCLFDGWCEVQRRFGTLPLTTLLESAIYHAREGFAATRTFCHFARDQAAALAADPAAASSFLPGGQLPALGTTIRQPALARTLERLAADGRRDFYEGETAHTLAHWMRDHGGLLALEDLRDCRAEIQAPIRTTYRGLEVLEAPPNSSGCTLLQELTVAERFDLQALAAAGTLPFESPDLIHTLVEIKKLCFVDRERIADGADEMEIVVRELLSKSYAARLADQVDPRRAISRPVGRPSAEANTTYLAVADEQGNAISGIQSLNDVFGAAVIAGDTGILLNNRMRYWHLDPAHANHLAPGRRVRHTMNPPLVLHDGRPYLILGTPGADAQVQVNLQVLTALVDFGLDPQQAVEMPRWQSLQPGTPANWPHTAPDQLVVEDRMPLAARAELARRGHRVETVGPLDGPCAVNVIRRDAVQGYWQAASDPRRDGYAVAF
jgi:gamma-glutamyltranspeptidase/glutathione hydrolase